MAFFFTASYIQWAKQVSDQRTLMMLNDALNRYKCEGGDVTALTAGAPISHVIAKLKTSVTWAGMSHQFLQSAFTCPGYSISAFGSNAQYRFTAFNTYTNESGGSSPSVRTYLATVGAGTWTVPNDFTAHNTIECIGDGGSSTWGGGGGGGLMRSRPMWCYRPALRSPITLVLEAPEGLSSTAHRSLTQTLLRTTDAIPRLLMAEPEGWRQTQSAPLGATAGPVDWEVAQTTVTVAMELPITRLAAGKRPEVVAGAVLPPPVLKASS